VSSAPPQLIGNRYRLVEPLGQGGMGRVWKARDEVLHRDVAIKELVAPPGLTEDERREMRERSLREARAIARLNHANVVRVFDVLRTDGDPWIVMEYIPSRSLQDVLATDGPVSPTRAAEIGLGVLGALKAAHRAGVMHRDVKPGNVLLGEDGRVVLTDFGLATVPGDPNVTRTGLVLGSPAYIAPERARDGTFGPEADLWSLGATLFAAVEGQSPFARPSAIATLAALATEPTPVPRHAGPLKTVLAGLLQKDPALRINAETAERLLRRAAGRRGRGGLSLLDSVRRSNSLGSREPGEPRARMAPLPAPRAGQKQPAAAAPDKPAPSAGAPAAPPPPPSAAPETAPLVPAAAETRKLSPTDAEASTAKPPAEDKAPNREESPAEAPSAADERAPAEERPAAEPTVVVPASGSAEASSKQEVAAPAPAPEPARTKPEPGPIEVVAPSAPSTGRTPGPAGTPATYEGGRAGRGALAGLASDRRLWLVGGLAVLVLLLIAVIVPLANGDSGDGGDGGTGPVANATSPAAPTPSAQATGAPPATPPSTPSAQPSATPTGQPDGQLPPGWRLHRDETGFSVPVPEGWEMTRTRWGKRPDEVRVYFRDPNSPKALLIDQNNSPKSDPVADWENQEKARKGRYRNYQRVTIKRVDYFDIAADWEWIYTDDGVRMHVRNRGFVTAKDKAYAIRWDAPADEWEESLADFQIIANGFRPVRD